MALRHLHWLAGPGGSFGGPRFAGIPDRAGKLTAGLQSIDIIGFVVPCWAIRLPFAR